MKKISLLLVLLCSLLMSGCSKDYQSFDEYSKDMDNVKKNHSSYMIEATIEGKHKTFNGSGTLYIKGNKWKEEFLSKSDIIGKGTYLYNGTELLSYNNDSDTALIDPSIDIAKQMLGDDMGDKAELSKVHSRLYKLINWADKIGTSFILNKDFKYSITKKNGFKCRMIKTDYEDICISDEYGIAVYYHDKKIMKETFNVKKISTSNIDDSVFELPQGMKKETYSDMLKQISEISERRNTDNNQ